MSIIVPWTTPGEDLCCCCNPPVLLCDSIQASKSKPDPCGYLVEGQYYLTRTYTLEGNFESHGSAPDGSASDEVRTFSFTQVTTFSTFPCEEILVNEYGSSAFTLYDILFGVTVVQDSHCESTYNFATSSWSGTFTDNLNPANNHPVSDPCYSPISPTSTTDYSDLWVPETNESLYTRTKDALPTYPGNFDGECSALRSLSPDEKSYTVERTKFKFRFTPPASGYTISWKEFFMPFAAGGTPTITPRTWTWDGSNPGVQQESEVFELLEGDYDGETTIGEIEVSCEP